MRFYRLEDGHPVQCELNEYLQSPDDDERIESTRLRIPAGDEILISTVFLGFDHNHCDDGPPILFETMIFGDSPFNEFQQRYSTLKEALTGHEVAVRMVDLWGSGQSHVQNVNESKQRHLRGFDV